MLCFHPKAVSEKKRRILFLASSLVFEMPISGGSAKRLWYLFFGAGTYYMVFFSGNIFSLGSYNTEDFRAVTFRKLFFLFTGILLKSRVCLKDPPPKLKVKVKSGLIRNGHNGYACRYCNRQCRYMHIIPAQYQFLTRF